jgi:tRNA 2-thiouridine synthesizing protein A
MERVDVTGEVCPRPALIVRRHLSDLDAGEALLVRGDYPPAEENLRRTCTKHGFEVTDAGGDGDDFELRISATEDAVVG